MIGYSLMQHAGRYSLSGPEFGIDAVSGLSGISLASRHFVLADRILREDRPFSEKALRFCWHATLGIIELTPLLGMCVASIERLFARVIFGQKALRAYSWLGAEILSSMDPRSLFARNPTAIIRVVQTEDLAALAYPNRHNEAPFYVALSMYFAKKTECWNERYQNLTDEQITDLNHRLDLMDVAFFVRDHEGHGVLFPNDRAQLEALQASIGVNVRRLQTLNVRVGNGNIALEGRPLLQAFIRREITFLKVLNRLIDRRLAEFHLPAGTAAALADAALAPVGGEDPRPLDAAETLARLGENLRLDDPAPVAV